MSKLKAMAAAIEKTRITDAPTDEMRARVSRRKKADPPNAIERTQAAHAEDVDEDDDMLGASENDKWSLRKLKAQTAKLEAETKAKELALQIQRGEYLPKFDVDLWAQGIIAAFSASLQRIPRRMASSLVGLEASQISTRLEKELGRVVADLRKSLEEMEVGEDE